MLHVYFGDMNPNVSYENYVWSAADAFDEDCSVDWILTDFAREVIRVVDRAAVDPSGVLYTLDTNERFSMRELSGGTKCVLWLKYAYTRGVVNVSFGENVTPFIERLGMEKDLWLQVQFDPNWRFIDPNGIHFIGLSAPTRDPRIAYTHYFKYMDEWTAQIREAINGKS